MEEVLGKLEATFVSEEYADKTNFQDLYKNWGRLGNQEERRKELLETQKQERRNKLDTVRGILEIVQSEQHDNIFKSNSRAYYYPHISMPGVRRKPEYQDALMLSEWLIEKPEDFHENWYITPCPKGRRVLVVASFGITKLYSKCGRCSTSARTNLPGGNPSSKRNSWTVLDGFYDEKRKTLHVLDLLAWNNQPMTDCDTEFRHFWLKSQFAQMPELKHLNKMNKIEFSLLPMVPCTLESLNNLMMTYPPFKDNHPLIDGLLFYHKQAHYVSGETPLVGWLFPYMVPEVLGKDINVHSQYMVYKPKDYVDQATFIQKFEEKYAKKRNRRSRGAMDTSDSSLDMSNTEEKKENNEVDRNAMDAEEVVKEETEVMESESAQNADEKIQAKSDNGEPSVLSKETDER